MRIGAEQEQQADRDQPEKGSQANIQPAATKGALGLVSVDGIRKLTLTNQGRAEEHRSVTECSYLLGGREKNEGVHTARGPRCDKH